LKLDLLQWNESGLSLEWELLVIGYFSRCP